MNGNAKKTKEIRFRIDVSASDLRIFRSSLSRKGTTITGRMREIFLKELKQSLDSSGG